jgi:hypothetical protein
MKRRFLFAAILPFFSFFVSGQTSSKAALTYKLCYDGYYRTLPDTLNPFSYYLRFYDDGTVIGYSTAGNPNNLLPWFKKEHKSPSKGQYTLKDSVISFSLKSEEGTVLYDGVFLPGNRLFLTVKSLINKYQGQEEYIFLKMEGIK